MKMNSINVSLGLAFSNFFFFQMFSLLLFSSIIIIAFFSPAYSMKYFFLFNHWNRLVLRGYVFLEIYV